MHKPRPSRGKADDPSDHIGFLDTVDREAERRKAERKARKEASGGLDLDRMWER